MFFSDLFFCIRMVQVKLLQSHKKKKNVTLLHNVIDYGEVPDYSTDNPVR